MVHAEDGLVWVEDRWEESCEARMSRGDLAEQAFLRLRHGGQVWQGGSRCMGAIMQTGDLVVFCCYRTASIQTITCKQKSVARLLSVLHNYSSPIAFN